VVSDHGAQAIFGGSYGWSSAGRFHHAQSQVHRFLNCALGGYTRSVNTYSAGASEVVFPHIAGPMSEICRAEATWDEIAEHSELVVAFGGLALRNSMVSAGGISRHNAKGALERAHARGAGFVLVSPLRDDLPPALGALWLAPRPNTDAALMLGLAHVLWSERLFDAGFVARHCKGFARFAAHLAGEDGSPAKDADWAAAICGIEAGQIRALARRMAASRCMITMSHSMQRAENGEQPVRLGVVLAAMLGQMGLKGGGFANGIGAIGNVGKPRLAVPIPTLPQGTNAVRDFIPVARISDLLLNPGGQVDYNGQRLTYPDIRLVYWAGGNPFHHHQDLNRLRRAFAAPETVVVHDAFWTASARHADVVLPATMTLERDDIGAAANDPRLIAMKAAFAPHAGARDDFAIFADLAARLGRQAEFTGNRTAAEWLRHLYEPTRAALEAAGHAPPDFDAFWARGEIDLPISTRPGMLRRFLADPEGAPLPTPSGRIEIFSATIESFGYEECRGLPGWSPPAEWLGAEMARDWPLHLVANQPATRLHSQLDFGAHSQAGKDDGREAMRIHPQDAARRAIADGDTVRLYNARGACLATARLSEDIRPGVVQLATGAWYAPQEAGEAGTLCLHGNPNVLTRDVGTSRLAQGTTGQLCLIEVEPYRANRAPFDPYAPPQLR
jgi:biotin/methionine sulfoxide reductase